MAIELPRSLVEYILLGPVSGRRQLQDSPILGDVWIGFARAADEPLDLLITPIRTVTAGAVAKAISEALGHRPDANISYLQSIVAANLGFEDVLRVVVPMTAWWHDRRNEDELKKYTIAADGLERLKATIDAVLPIAKNWKPGTEDHVTGRPLAAVDRYVALAGLILWAAGARSRGNAVSLTQALRDVTAQTIADLLSEVFEKIQKAGDAPTLVWQVSLNRTAMPAIAKSVPAVK